ncbi:hypothetical protein [Aquimarina pacifica]|uniref:hypothetical protein n=1 Tax=Aquimarina pacifica TaxID=1296415 RepID=UPI000470E563|nr:hypothetical protein [Aquimarina pacifica]
MKIRSVFWMVICITLFACQHKKQGPTDYQKIVKENFKEEMVDTSLTKGQLDKIHRLHKIFSEVYPESLDEFIVTIKKNANPDQRITVWSAMADSYTKFSLKNDTDEYLEKRKEAFRLILMRSILSERETKKSFELKELTREEADILLSDYTLDKAPIKIETH